MMAGVSGDWKKTEEKCRASLVRAYIYEVAIRCVRHRIRIRLAGALATSCNDVLRSTEMTAAGRKLWIRNLGMNGVIHRWNAPPNQEGSHVA